MVETLQQCEMMIRDLQMSKVLATNTATQSQHAVKTGNCKMLNLNKQWGISFPLLLMTLCNTLPRLALRNSHLLPNEKQTLKNINLRIHENPGTY